VFTTLAISGFRAFRELLIPRLARVNLFVGTNNAGKTSILEAAELLAEASLAALLRGPLRRGERMLAGRGEERVELQLDPAHLFYGRRLRPGAHLSIFGEGAPLSRVRCEFVEIEGNVKVDLGQPSLFLLEPSSPGLALRFESHILSEAQLLRLTPRGGLEYSARDYAYSPPEGGPPVRFVTTEEVRAFRLGQLWDEVALTPEEESIVSTLRIIEPAVERIAFLGGEGRQASRSVFLKLRGSERRVPLGSLGDGLKRLLALTLHLVSARKGFLLVDEIDTGLHHTVMADMWRLVIETARRLDVQVFATTHSLDCVHALAWVQQQSPETASQVLLHRIEKDARETVAYTLDELAIAARSQLEVR
jgi:ABC-type branched-subunit amino acid transport system ATPase component